MQDPERDRFKLYLHCTMLITACSTQLEPVQPLLHVAVNF